MFCNVFLCKLCKFDLFKVWDCLIMTALKLLMKKPNSTCFCVIVWRNLCSQATFCVHELAVGASLSRAEPAPRGPTAWARRNDTPRVISNPVQAEAQTSGKSNVQNSTTNSSKGNTTNGSHTWRLQGSVSWTVCPRGKGSITVTLKR